MKSKMCSTCAKELPVESFGKDKYGIGGYKYSCNACRRVTEKESAEKRKIEILEKECKKCNITKSIDLFYREASSKDGHHSCCKECKNSKTMLWRENNKEHYNDCMKIKSKRYYSKGRLRRYNMTEQQYLEMLREQDGKCKICHKEPGKSRPLVVDHNHETGEIRGLLCYGCNRHVAAVDSALLKTILEYVKK